MSIAVVTVLLFALSVFQLIVIYHLRSKLFSCCQPIGNPSLSSCSPILSIRNESGIELSSRENYTVEYLIPSQKEVMLDNLSCCNDDVVMDLIF